MGDGTYWLDIDGSATEMECDMSTEVVGGPSSFQMTGTTPDSGWSITDDDGSAVTVATTTCGSWGSILGGYEVIAGGEIDITLDAFDINHTEAWIALDYLSIDSWDNEAMYMDVDSTNIWAEAQNNHSSVYGEVCGWDRGYYGSYDSLEPVSEFFSHTDSEMELVVGSTLDQSASDESFGIDNVKSGFVKSARLGHRHSRPPAASFHQRALGYTASMYRFTVSVLLMSVGASPPPAH